MDVELKGLVEALAEKLVVSGWKVVTAESCTGGWLAQVLTSVAGSSTWFERGFVSYSNESKQDLLEVSPLLLSQHGAVSEAVVEAMALGALTNSHANVSIAITGIAGPDGGSADKPVGTVFFGIASKHRCGVFKKVFRGDREEIRRQAVVCALEGLLQFEVVVDT